MTKRRAKKGGEVGRNGEFYPGGKFLPSTRLPKGSRPSYSGGDNRWLVEPGILATIPEGSVAIFPQIMHIVAFENGRAVPKFPDDHPAMIAHTESPAHFHKLVALFNAYARHYPKGSM